MRNLDEVEAACERAAKMQGEAEENGSKYFGMKYEDGLREAFDWVMENMAEDPTLQ
jgi:hypothetical protein